jgi:hypothetical protein
VRSFACPVCGHLVFFENSGCLHCGTELGYCRSQRELVALDGHVRCANAEVARCNWLVDAPGLLCGSCLLTRTRPADADLDAMAAFADAEAAKRRLVYQLDDLSLPTDGVGFDLLSSAEEPVTTGHADGVVTIDLVEGDDAHREALRVQLAEPYRTMLGHLRHETGHYYWTVLVEPSPSRFRELFGDERADYAEALQRHYSSPAPVGWEQEYVSTYATAHPWEDWAESFAHYLHIRDTLQTAAAYGMQVHGRPPGRDAARGPRRVRRDHRHLAAPHLRAQRGEPVDGQGRPLPIRALPGGAGQVRPRLGSDVAYVAVAVDVQVERAVALRHRDAGDAPAGTSDQEPTVGREGVRGVRGLAAAVAAPGADEDRGHAAPDGRAG